jgi:cell division protein FtsB
MQIKTKLQPYVLDFIRRLNDVRFVGQVIFVVVVLLVSWSGIKSIQTNYGLQKQITALKQQNDLQKLQNSNQALQNEYYKSNQYLELSARQNFGLAAPGEKEIIVPKDVALAHAAKLPKPTTADLAKEKQPAYQRNFESWINFFLHRQNSGD